MANFRYSHLFTTKAGNAAIEAAAAKLNAAEIALAIADGEEKILFKNENGDVVAVATEEQIIALFNTINNNLNAEISRATSAETELDKRVADIESGSTQALNDEIARAKEAEAALDEAIEDVEEAVSAETSARKNADDALDDKIDAENERATSAETALFNLIEAEVANRVADVNSEENRAISAETALNNKIDDEIAERKLKAFASTEYNSENKHIEFFNENNTLVDYIDATDFIKDGMIEDVRIETISGVTYLVIDFNTASGKEDIKIPITDIFDASNYYTKYEVNEIVSAITAATDEAIEAEELRAKAAESGLSDSITAEATARANADVVAMNVAADAGITLTLGNGSTITATEAEEITLSAGEF